MSDLNLQVFTYGENGKRAEIELLPQIPEDIRGNVEQMKSWSQTLIESMGKDFKYTGEWNCEICGEPARETKYDMASWMHLEQPRMVVYIHHVCEVGNNTCSNFLDTISARMNALGGLRPKSANLDTPGGVEYGAEYPLPGSCLNCQTDASAKGPLSRCGGCKLVRYCSTECQNTDWKRHKKVCKMIKNVKWVEGS